MSYEEQRAAEDSVRYWAGVVGGFEEQIAQEYLLLMASGTYPTWQAQKMAESRFVKELRGAQAEYEIALARLRRA